MTVISAYLLDENDVFVGELQVDELQSITQKITVAQPPILTGSQVAQLREGNWIVLNEYPAPSSLTPEQLAEKQQAETFRIKQEVVAATQKRLDDFSRTRNYDGILSACTYATSAIPKFAAEGQYCVNIRDTTWAALYALLAEVEAGTRSTPSGFSEIEPLLPTLEWPA